jgi:hypothetical protein
MLESTSGKAFAARGMRIEGSCEIINEQWKRFGEGPMQRASVTKIGVSHGAFSPHRQSQMEVLLELGEVLNV